MSLFVPSNLILSSKNTPCVLIENLTSYFYIHQHSLPAVLRQEMWFDTTTCVTAQMVLA